MRTNQQDYHEHHRGCRIVLFAAEQPHEPDQHLEPAEHPDEHIQIDRVRFWIAGAAASTAAQPRTPVTDRH